MVSNAMGAAYRLVRSRHMLGWRIEGDYVMVDADANGQTVNTGLDRRKAGGC